MWIGFSGHLTIQTMTLIESDSTIDYPMIQLEDPQQYKMKGWVEAFISVNDTVWCSHAGTITIIDMKVLSIILTVLYVRH